MSNITAADIKAEFLRVDKNQDGCLSREQLKAVIREVSALQSKAHFDELDAIFQLLEVDARGLLKYDNFIDWCFDVQAPTLQEEPPKIFKLHAAVPNGRSATIEAKTNSTLKTLQMAIRASLKIPANEQQLILGSTIVADPATDQGIKLGSLGFGSSDTAYLTVMHLGQKDSEETPILPDVVPTTPPPRPQSVVGQESATSPPPLARPLMLCAVGPDGKSTTIETKTSASLKTLQMVIRASLKVPAKEQQLLLGTLVVADPGTDPSATLESLGLTSSDEVRVLTVINAIGGSGATAQTPKDAGFAAPLLQNSLLKSRADVIETGKTFKLRVVIPNGRSDTIVIRKDAVLKDLQIAIQSALRVPARQQHLSLGTNVIADANTDENVSLESLGLSGSWGASAPVLTLIHWRPARALSCSLGDVFKTLRLGSLNDCQMKVESPSCIEILSGNYCLDGERVLFNWTLHVQRSPGGATQEDGWTDTALSATLKHARIDLAFDWKQSDGAVVASPEEQLRVFGLPEARLGEI